MADARISELTAIASIAGEDLLAVVDDPSGTPATTKATVTQVKDYIISLANTWAATQTITPAANTSALASTGYSLTGSNAQSLVDLAGTWNTSGTPTAIKLNVTDTASNASSLLMDLQVGGSSKASFSKGGKLVIARWSANNGSSTALPDISGTLSATSGIYLSNANAVGLVANGTLATHIDNNFYLTVLNTGGFAWSGTGAASGTRDLILSRRGAANLTLGAADAAAPVAQTLSVQSVVAGTSNTAGANLTITGSQGTGTGAGGSIIFQVAPAGSSGTAQNALSTALTIASDLTATFAGSSTTVQRIVASAAGSVLSGTQIGSRIDMQGVINGISIGSDCAYGFHNAAAVTGTVDVFLYRDAANILALRNSTNTQTFRWYRTFTDASNYERGALQTAAGEIILAAETAGTGTDDIDVSLVPAGAGVVKMGTHSAIGAETVTGFITIKDAGGTTRKLAVVS